MNIFKVQEPGDGNRELILDVDPEAVRRGVKALMQQVAQIERERVRYDFEIFIAIRSKPIKNLNLSGRL